MKSAQTKYTYQYNRTFPSKGQRGLGTLDASILIKSKTACIFTPNQLEAARRILSKPIRKQGAKLNIRVLPNLTISKKPLQTRMGKGKGRPDGLICCLSKGAPLFAIHGNVPLTLIKQLYKRVNFRLPVYSKLVLNKKLDAKAQRIHFKSTLKKTRKLKI